LEIRQVSFSAYSPTPALNVSLNGINIDEGCAAGNLNNAVRQLAADGKALSDTVAAINVSGYMLVAGGAFTGNIVRSGAGAYWYHANSSQASAPVYTQLSSAALPSSPAEGTVVFQY
jgi:hypothetical protein